MGESIWSPNTRRQGQKGCLGFRTILAYTVRPVPKGINLMMTSCIAQWKSACLACVYPRVQILSTGSKSFSFKSKVERLEICVKHTYILLTYSQECHTALPEDLGSGALTVACNSSLRGLQPQQTQCLWPQGPAFTYHMLTRSHTHN